MSGMNYEQENDDKREYRRKRRKKNQLIAYICVLVALVLIGVGIFFAVTAVSSALKQREMERKAEEQASLEVVTEMSEEETETVPEETTTEEVVEYTNEELLDEIVQTCISEMPLEDRVAGLFFITPEALTGVDTVIKAGDGTKEALAKYAVGGLIYFKQNIKSKDQITEMLGNTVAMSKYPIFLAVDEEGGSVARVADALNLEKVKDASVLGEALDEVAVKDSYAKIGAYLCEYGFNLDFAPVADVLTNPDNESIAKRSFGSDAEVVAKMVSNAVAGLEEHGVTACLKHFPGQGGANADTHETLASSERTLEELRETELKPFVAGIEAGAQMIMVGHFTIPSITGEDTPASLSKEIMTELLRDEMGYEGVIITDALNMKAITEKYASDEACIAALEAGADMLLMPEDFELAYNGLLSAVQEGKISEARINDSLSKIYKIKYKNAIDN